MMLGCVEVDVVGDGERQVHLRVSGGHQQVLDGLPEPVLRQPGRDLGPDLSPCPVARGQEQVEVSRAEQVGATGQQAFAR